eukprot:4324150-Heterocapsa_arctica.AAC.1
MLDRDHIVIKANLFVFVFLVAHAAFLYNRFQARVNGLTPSKDVHRKAFRDVLFHFGDPVL